MHMLYRGLNTFPSLCGGNLDQQASQKVISQYEQCQVLTSGAWMSHISHGFDSSFSDVLRWFGDVGGLFVKGSRLVPGELDRDPRGCGGAGRVGAVEEALLTGISPGKAA
jgi:hypothetical protein